MTVYTPPSFRRYFAWTDDPTAGGSNADTVAAAAAPFTGGVIPDQTNTVPVENFNVQWGETDLDYSHLITGVRAGPVMLPFKSLPVLSLTADTHRYMIERLFKLVMGGEGTITSTNTYEVDSVALGAATAGTFVLSFLWNGNIYTTAAIAFNATAAAVASAVLAATGGPALPAGGVVGSAGPLPAATTLTFAAGMAGPVTNQTITGTGLTGGTPTFTRTTPGVGGRYVHPLTGAPIGTTSLPMAMAHTLRDALNIKLSGIAFESVEMTLDSQGPGKLVADAHPLYGQIIDDHLAPTVPTGVLAEPTVKPMLLRDVQINLDGGSVFVGVNAFRFGFKNNNVYDRQVAGICVGQQILNGKTYKMWWPCYHRITGRQTVSWGFDLKDSDVATELRQQWRQVTSVVATAVDPTGTTDQVQITLPAAVLMGAGGIGQASATGDLPSSFNGQAFYDTVTGTDCTVAVTNSRATPISVI